MMIKKEKLKRLGSRLKSKRRKVLRMEKSFSLKKEKTMTANSNTVKTIIAKDSKIPLQ
jgi:hypothetical protein